MLCCSDCGSLDAAADMCVNLGQQLLTLPKTPANACSLSNLRTSEPKKVMLQMLTFPGWQVDTPEFGTLVPIRLKLFSEAL